MSRSVGSFVNRVVYFSMKDSSAVKRLTNRLISTPKDSIILPFTDYPGPLTSEILSRKFASLTVCERDQEAQQIFHVSCIVNQSLLAKFYKRVLIIEP